MRFVVAVKDRFAVCCVEAGERFSLLLIIFSSHVLKWFWPQ
jgi:hypothetical protein